MHSPFRVRNNRSISIAWPFAWRSVRSVSKSAGFSQSNRRQLALSGISSLALQAIINKQWHEHIVVAAAAHWKNSTLLSMTKDQWSAEWVRIALDLEWSNNRVLQEISVNRQTLVDMQYAKVRQLVAWVLLRSIYSRLPVDLKRYLLDYFPRYQVDHIAT